jgi:hypothetical protein
MLKEERAIGSEEAEGVSGDEVDAEEDLANGYLSADDEVVENVIMGDES